MIRAICQMQKVPQLMSSLESTSVFPDHKKILNLDSQFCDHGGTTNYGS